MRGNPLHRSKLFAGPKVFRKRLRTLVRKPIFLFITLWGHASIAAGTLGFYYFEHEANPKIHSLLDTFYWSIATVTTVGYGDAAPVTTGGKIVGMLMMVLGSLFLWSYTALFAGGLVAPEIRLVEEEVRDLEGEVRDVEQDVRLDKRSLEHLLTRMETIVNELEKRKGSP